MTEDIPTYSVAKVGKRYFWVVERGLFWGHSKALAEGFALAKEEALVAAKKAIAELGIEAREAPAYYAKSYRKHCRAALMELKEPQTSTFQGNPHLWSLSDHLDDQTSERIYQWLEHQVVKVTDKYVFVSQEYSETNKRLDRASLERDGRAKSWERGLGHTTYYTETQRKIVAAEMAEKERLEQEQLAVWREEQAKRDEQVRLTLIGKDCIFCGGTPECYTQDQAPSCNTCYMKAQGYYRVPAGMFLPFRTID